MQNAICIDSILHACNFGCYIWFDICATLLGQSSATEDKERNGRLLKMEKKKKSEIHIQHVGRDRPSDLPNHVLLRIIEFMNIKCSVQTCVLSKRWKDIWKSLTRLLFVRFYEDDDITNKFVSHILSGRDDDANIPLHSLTYIHYDDNIHPHITTILKVIKYAASHNVKKLKVDVDGFVVLKELELPPSIFYCRSLTFLHLRFWWKHSYDTKKIIPKFLNLPLLKTLHLENLSFTASDNGCVEPFSTCNMLNTLVIIGCRLQDDTQTLCISNSNVSSLTLAWIHMHKVVICTPKLTSLTISGLLNPTFQVPSEYNLPFLEEVNIDYSFLYKPDESLVMISWLQLFDKVKIMTLGFDTLKETFKVSYFSIFYPFYIFY